MGPGRWRIPFQSLQKTGDIKCSFLHIQMSGTGYDELEELRKPRRAIAEWKWKNGRTREWKWKNGRTREWKCSRVGGYINEYSSPCLLPYKVREQGRMKYYARPLSPQNYLSLTHLKSTMSLLTTLFSRAMFCPWLLPLMRHPAR